MNHHALLIGIDHYDPNDYCSSLEGSVADIEAMQEFLLRQDVPSEKIRRLMSPHGAEERLSQEDLPTYENLVAAFQRLTCEAQPGDQVLIHYSGHGGRTPTLIPDSKGSKGADEGLVPPNVGDPEARYLRDVEISYLIDKMVEKGLLVTLILDACHSAGLVRGNARMVPRGSRRVDETPRPLDSLVATRDELESSWRGLHRRAYVTTRGTTGNPRSASGWMPPNAEGAVVLAACRSFESAYEYPFGGKSRGVLTYCLLELLAEGGQDLSFQHIYNRLVGRVHRLSPYQTPVLEGDASRRVLGGRLRGLRHGINVLGVDAKRRRVLLNAGQALGLRKGALLRVSPETSPGDPGGGPIVELDECDAVKSWGTVQGAGAEAPEVRCGDQAVLIDPGRHFRQRVAWVRPPSEGGEQQLSWWRCTFPQLHASRSGLDLTADVSRFLDSVQQVLVDRSSGFLELAEEDGEADFQVAVNPRGEIEIWHADGRAVADLPHLSTTAEAAPERVVDQLIHLAKFRNVTRLENDDTTSPLYRQLTVEIGRLPRDFVVGDRLEPRPFEPPGSHPTVKIGCWICLSITNHSLQPLHLYVLDLQPGWSIEQIHPVNGLETLEGGEQLRLPFEIYLPKDFESQRETLKVFGTSDPADFRWLELPAIGQPPRGSRSGLGMPRDPLAELFAEVARDGPRTRHVRTHHASRHWASAQVELEILGRCDASG